MARENIADKDTISIKIAIFLSFISLTVGFVSGIFFYSWFIDPDQSVQRTDRPAPAVSQQAIPPEMMAKIRLLQNEVTRNPEKTQGWVQLGNVYFDTDQFQNAIDAYQKALELDKSNPDVWTDLGVMFRRNKEPAAALGAFKEAVKINPRHEQALFNQGVVFLHDMGDTVAAIEVWEKICQLNPQAKAPNGQSLPDLVKKLKQGSGS
ncbi:tetratricopeptide repeat protein [candidate division CSSED10-310 bacterium]|uniref:Tetratricopeptide repeat protein n=1 Tax=candidate division CSSED10-310 bacterium TaxID=2855610 RepID=A0ABV6YWH8_UNCC1